MKTNTCGERLPAFRTTNCGLIAPIPSASATILAISKAKTPWTRELGAENANCAK
jgi:hypothetical protein